MKDLIFIQTLSGSNVVSVAEHVIMTMLILVRNYNVGHEQISQNKEKWVPVREGIWKREAGVSDLESFLTSYFPCYVFSASTSFLLFLLFLFSKVDGTSLLSLAMPMTSKERVSRKDVWARAISLPSSTSSLPPLTVFPPLISFVNPVIGTIAAGRIGYRVLQRLVPFNPKELLYYDYTPLPAAAEKEVNARRVEDLKEFLGQCDIVTVNCPLHEGTKDLLNKETIGWLKDGAWVVNTARWVSFYLLALSSSYSLFKWLNWPRLLFPNIHASQRSYRQCWSHEGCCRIRKGLGLRR